MPEDELDDSRRPGAAARAGAGAIGALTALLGGTVAVHAVLVLRWVVPRLGSGSVLLQTAIWPLLLGGIAAAATGSVLVWRALRGRPVGRRTVLAALGANGLVLMPPLIWIGAFTAHLWRTGDWAGWWNAVSAPLLPAAFMVVLGLWLAAGGRRLAKGWTGTHRSRAGWTAWGAVPALVAWVIAAAVDRVPAGDVVYRGHTAGEWAALCYDAERELEAWVALEAMQGDGAIGFGAIVAYEYGAPGRFAANWVDEVRRAQDVLPLVKRIYRNDGLLPPALEKLVELGPAAEPAVPLVAGVLPPVLWGVEGSHEAQRHLVRALRDMEGTAHGAVPALLAELERSDMNRQRIIAAAGAIVRDGAESDQAAVVAAVRPYVESADAEVALSAHGVMLRLSPDAAARDRAAEALARYAIDQVQPIRTRMQAARILAEEAGRSGAGLAGIRAVLQPALGRLRPVRGPGATISLRLAAADWLAALWQVFAAQPELEGEWLGLVQAALAHPRWPVRERAVLTLAANAQMAPALRDTLWRLLEDAQVGEPVAWALLGLDQTSDDLATRCARSVLRSRGIDNEDALVFETAFWKLEDAAQERAVSRLRALAATEHPGADDARKVLDLFKHFFEPAGE